MSRNHTVPILLGALGTAAVCLFVFSTVILHNNPTPDLSHRASPENTEIPENIKKNDVNPPFIEYSDITVYKGDAVSYRQYISAHDDVDPNPKLNIDASNVNLDEYGTYTVTVSATDASGNTSTPVSVTLTVAERPNQVEYDYVHTTAASLVEQITSPDMSEMQRAFAIFNWVRANINWNDFSEKDDVIRGAYDGFTKRSGDCYTYFSCAKMMLEEAGFETVDVVKIRSSEQVSRHYWSLVKINGGWYHFDATLFSRNNDLFLLTDAELAAWDETYFPGQDIHPFNGDAYPARATESVQAFVDYERKTVNG